MKVINGSIGLIMCLAVNLLWSPISHAESEANKENSLVQKLHQSYQGIRYFQSDFKQIKTVKFLSKPITSTGQFTFSPELGLVWEVKSPVWVKTLINDEGVFKSNSRIAKQKVKDPQIKVVASILSELFSSQLDRVESQFNIKEVIEDNEAGQWSVTLEAKGSLIKKAITSISITGQLSASQSDNGIESLVIVDASNNETLISLSKQIISQTALTDVQRHAFD